MSLPGRPAAKTARHRLVPMAAGLFVVGYVLLLLAVTFAGQHRLREALDAQQQFGLEKSASALGYFFDERRRDVERLREDHALESFFANQALGMSMEYGLQASLRNVERTLKRVAEKTKINGWPVFRRIVVLDNDRMPLADTSAGEPPIGLRLSAADEASKSVAIVIGRDRGVVTISLQARYDYKGWPAGYVVASIDQDTAFEELVRDMGEAAHLNLTVVDEQGLRVMGSQQLGGASADPADPVFAAAGAGSTRPGALRAPIPGTSLTIVRQSPDFWGSDYLTSSWLTGSLGVLALLVLAGATVTLRIRTQNLMLQAQVGEAARQEEQLNHKNERLEEEMRVRLQYEEQLLRQANYDQLTGLPNRNLATDRLEQAMSRGRRTGSQVVVMYLDLDRFKNVNDTLGHSAGDQVLLQAAGRLSQVARANDTVARLGGDEFLIVMADVEPGHSAEKAAERVAEAALRSFSEPFPVSGQEFFVSISIGISVFPDDGDKAERLLQHADTALYQAKEEGRHAFRFFTPDMNRRAQRRASMETHLLHALERRELSLVYQPIVSLQTGSTVAFEALLRWQNPVLGAVSPALFIPLAEETGLIQEIGEWVLDQAIADLACWDADPGLRVAVNVSSRQLRNPRRFLRALEVALYRHRVQPSQLELEITERLLLEELPDTALALRELDALGVRLSIDDFGTGYSSLGYLKRFPVDVLKIDRSFVNGVLKDSSDAALVRAILALAQALHLSVVAEGVESPAQAEFLHTNGCPCGQGFWFSRPLRPEDVPAFLAAPTAPPEARVA
jgi:diguanylate cyclase (GGDEF)-like protein